MEERIIAELQALFAGESSGHDLFHTLRVTRTAQRIASRRSGAPQRMTPARGAFWPAAACRRNGSKR